MQEFLLLAVRLQNTFVKTVRLGQIKNVTETKMIDKIDSVTQTKLLFLFVFCLFFVFDFLLCDRSLSFHHFLLLRLWEYLCIFATIICLCSLLTFSLANPNEVQNIWLHKSNFMASLKMNSHLRLYICFWGWLLHSYGRTFKIRNT